MLDSLKSPDAIIIKLSDGSVCGCNSTYINSYNNCAGCGYPKADHIITCSPIPELKREIISIFINIQGLEWSRFVHNTKIDGTTTTNEVPVNQDLWDYL